LISVVSRVESTVVVGSLTVTTHISPVGVGDRLDSGGAVGLSWQGLADDSTELSGELLGEEQILRRARGSDAAGDVVHELRVAANTLRVAIAFGGKALSTFLLHTLSESSCIILDEKMEFTYSAGGYLSDVDAESLTETHRNSRYSCSFQCRRGSSGIGDQSCEAQEESRSLLHVDLTDQLVLSS
jgi:hypothetical protein